MPHMAYSLRTNKHLTAENEHLKIAIKHLCAQNINLEARIALLEIAIEDSERASSRPGAIKKAAKKTAPKKA